MDPGRLKHLVQIEKPTGTLSGGETTVAWSDVGAPVWAAVEPVRSREYMQAQAPHADVSHRVTIRFGVEAKSTYRIVFRGAHALR